MLNYTVGSQGGGQAGVRRVARLRGSSIGSATAGESLSRSSPEPDTSLEHVT